VLGFPIGSQEVTAAESDAYLNALPHVPSAIRLTVADADVATTTGVLRGLGLRSVRLDAAAATRFLIANPHGWSAEEHPRLRSLLDRLGRADVRIRSLSVP
jgi:hypothetical protein